MIADAARKVIEPFAVAMRKLAAAAMPKPKHEQIRAALASPLLGLGGKLPRTLFPSTLVPGLGPEWWQERERRRKQAEDAADRRMGKAEKDAAEQAKKAPGRPQETPDPNQGPDAPDKPTPGFKRKL